MDSELSYGKRMHRAARQDFKKFWSAHRWWSTFVALMATVAGILIQMTVLGVGSVANLELTVTTGLGALAVSLFGNYIISMRRGAETLDSGLRKEITEKNSALEKFQGQSAAPKVSSLEHSRRDLVKGKLEVFTQEERGALKYILQHGQIDSVFIVTAEPKDQQSFSNATQKGFVNGLLANGPQSGGSRTVIVNPDLIDALSFHLLE